MPTFQADVLLYILVAALPGVSSLCLARLLWPTLMLGLRYILLFTSLWYHAGHRRPYIIVSTSALTIDYICKFCKTRVRTATLTSLPGGLTKIEVDRLSTGWRAGQHVALRVIRGADTLEKHPFTIANAPATIAPNITPKTLEIVAKNAGDFTKAGHQSQVSADRG